MLETKLLLDGNTGLPEGVKHLGFAEARGVVFKGETAGGLVHMETAEAVGVSEFAEALELFVAEGSEQFVADFQKCHGESIAEVGIAVAQAIARFERRK